MPPPRRLRSQDTKTRSNNPGTIREKQKKKGNPPARQNSFMSEGIAVAERSLSLEPTRSASLSAEDRLLADIVLTIRDILGLPRTVPIASATRLVEDLGADELDIEEGILCDLLHQLALQSELDARSFQNDRKTYEGKTVADLLALVLDAKEAERARGLIEEEAAA